MQVTFSLIKQLANLAQLEFTDEEAEEFRSDLEQMIAFVEKLNEIDTAHVQPLLHLSTASNVFRNDEPMPSLSREIALMNAPVKDNNFFLVPKVIQKTDTI
jgi:aspartyl-tRNA(Asn)/glutamyl-tRNA(Gln) amidotransferase subunit C